MKRAEIGQIYDKHHLVPFGEYLPLEAVLSTLGMGVLTETYGGFTPGAGPALIDLGPIGKALALICYEAVFPHQMTSADGRPRFLLHVTNDAWFGTWSGPYQHLAQAQFRAIEQGLPLLRSANTGITASIDANGQILRSLALGESGYLDATLPPRFSTNPLCTFRRHTCAIDPTRSLLCHTFALPIAETLTHGSSRSKSTKTATTAS